MDIQCPGCNKMAGYIEIGTEIHTLEVPNNRHLKESTSLFHALYFSLCSCKQMCVVSAPQHQKEFAFLEFASRPPPPRLTYFPSLLLQLSL